MNDSTNSAHTINMEKANTGASPYLHFAKLLKNALNYPIGLVQTAYGGSPLSRWNPAEKGDLYKSMVETAASLRGVVKGVLWYQGESDANSDLSHTYLDRFKNMVTSLRDDIGNPDLHILTTQLNRFIGKNNTENDNGWGMLREAQRRAAYELENIYVIPTFLSGLCDAIHNNSFSNLAIGERLARVALNKIYQKGAPYNAPQIEKICKADVNTIRLSFQNVYERLSCHETPDKMPFAVIDEAGQNNIIAYSEDGSEISLKLERDILGSAVVHGMHAANPIPNPPMDKGSQLPILAFYGFEVE